MSIARSLFTAALFVGAVTAATAPALIPPPTQCACGYQDSGSLQVYTDALIVYFNETSATEFDAFTNQEFANKKQQGWQSIYREGAQPANVEFVTANFSGKGRASVEPVLQLSLDPPDRYHLVNGGSLQSVRKDIQYGIFQASLQSAAPWSGGTALSFVLGFNSSDSLEMDFLNMNDPKQAVVSYLFNGEVPSAGTVTNYTTLQDADVDPWAFTEVQMDWNKTDLAFYIAGNNTRSVSKNGNTLPQAGKWLNLKTWSTGDQTYMAGPPSGNASTSHVLYVRTFFNSSVWTDAEHLEFDQRCQNVVYCSIDDMTLRGYTPYGQASTRPWQAPVVDKEIRKNAGIVAGVFSTFGIIALINVLLRRMPWRKLFTRSKGSSSAFASLRAFLRGSMYKRSIKSLQHKPAQATDEITQRSGRRFPFSSGASTSGIRTPLPAYGAMTPRSGNQTPAPGYQTPVPGYQSPASGYQTPVPGYQTPVAEYATSRNGSIDVPPVPRRVGTATTSSSDNSITHLASASTSSSASQESASEDENPALPPIDETGPMVYRQDKPALERSHPTGDIDVIAKTVQVNAAVLPALGISEKGKLGGVHISPLQVVGDPAATRPVPAKRIDYLAGLVAVACLAVTLHHFCQTFWPYVSDGYGPVAHYPGAEKWLSIFVGSYLLTQLWIGPFFLTATRFLSTNYLRNGNLEDIAKKELRRAPRLFVPIIIISLLEYFFLSLNLQADLQYLPSITWSTWPYVVPQPNFGVYLNNIVELAYAIPNVIPEIVSHYCIGVLWTVPVQLQFTYVVLTATVLIREIKTPWKRFGFYTLVILAGWYAKSWSACHWAGLVLSDLENTYKWKIYLRNNFMVYWTVLTIALAGAMGAPLIAVFNQNWSFATAENDIHPDQGTGRPIGDIAHTYPNYNEPTLAILVFSIGLQIIIELSPAVQWVLSLRPILWMHPHIMTIYLTHGFVMWTWGAWVAVELGTAGVPYWANLLVTLVTCYILIFALAAVLSPLMEVPVQGVMRTLDRWTKHEPVPPRKTIAPFTKDLLPGGAGKDPVVGES